MEYPLPPAGSGDAGTPNVVTVTVVALPLLVDKEFDFVTAMLISLSTVSQNKAVMIFWAAIVAACLLIAMAPVFLGLFIALPVLGHATWHLYRRALYHPL